MLRNYLKIAWRILSKDGAITLVNYVGLTIGVVSSLMIALYIRHGTSYDKHIPDTENMVLIIVSLLIAMPICIYFMKQWIEDYKYRIDGSWEVFALAGIAAILIALSTISYHALKTALVNPIHSLRDE